MSIRKINDYTINDEVFMTEKMTDLEKQENLNKTDKRKKRKQRHKFDFFGLFIDILCEIVTSIFSFLYQVFGA